MTLQDYPGNRARSFQTTRWTIVLAAGAAPSMESNRALEALCTTYWYPLYAYARRHGYSPVEAEDRAQEFFSNLLERNYLDRATPELGRFRAFLLTAYKRFLATTLEQRQALKRGGGRRFFSLNTDEAEARLVRESVHASTPVHAFEREWAITLLNNVLDLLQDEFAKRDRAGLFDKLKGSLSGCEPTDYEALTSDTGMTAGALRVAVHRMRQRYGELLRQEIFNTISSEDEFDDEYHSLLDALRKDP